MMCDPHHLILPGSMSRMRVETAAEQLHTNHHAPAAAAGSVRPCAACGRSKTDRAAQAGDLALGAPCSGVVLCWVAVRMAGVIRAGGRLQWKVSAAVGMRQLMRGSSVAPTATLSRRLMATAASGVPDAPAKEERQPRSSLITPRTRQVSATESHEVALAQTGWRQTMLKLTGCASCPQLCGNALAQPDPARHVHGG